MHSYDALEPIARQRRAALLAEAEPRRMGRAGRGRRVPRPSRRRPRRPPAPRDGLLPAGT